MWYLILATIAVTLLVLFLRERRKVESLLVSNNTLRREVARQAGQISKMLHRRIKDLKEIDRLVKEAEKINNDLVELEQIYLDITTELDTDAQTGTVEPIDPRSFDVMWKQLANVIENKTTEPMVLEMNTKTIEAVSEKVDEGLDISAQRYGITVLVNEEIPDNLFVYQTQAEFARRHSLKVTTIHARRIVERVENEEIDRLDEAERGEDSDEEPGV